MSTDKFVNPYREVTAGLLKKLIEKGKLTKFETDQLELFEQLESVTDNPRNIKNIKNPSEEVQVAAIARGLKKWEYKYKPPSILKLIKNPSPKARLMVNEYNSIPPCDFPSF